MKYVWMFVYFEEELSYSYQIVYNRVRLRDVSR